MFRFIYDEESVLRLSCLAIVVGLVAGVGAAVFRIMIAIVHNFLFFGAFSIDYNTSQHTAVSPFGAWIILVPVAGAVVVAFLVKNFAPEAKGHGVPEVIDAIYYKGGVIRPLVAVIKAIASAISIGSGGSIGREGPIMQIGSSFGSTLGQVIRIPNWQRVTLIASGASGGIAATFNTPLGGLLFAIELVLPETSSRTLVPVAVATGAASFVGRLLLGNEPAFHIPNLSEMSSQLVSPAHMLAYIVFGLVVGLISVVFIRMIYRFEDWFDAMPGNYYTRHCLGMLILGLVMYAFMTFAGHYYIQGVGYATVEDALTHNLINPYLIIALLIGKLLATSLTLGSGASGGIFSPSLFLGAVSGTAMAWIVNLLLPSWDINAVNLAVVGMATMVGAATGAVLTAVVMTFELTRDYFVIIPLITSVAIAYGVRRRLLTDNIYTFKLTRRGHYIPDSLQTNLYMLQTAADIRRTRVLRLAADDSMAGMRRQMRRQRRRSPHLLIIKDGQVSGALSGQRARALSRRTDCNGEDAVSQHVEGGFIVVGARELVFDIAGKLRSATREVAVVTPDGEMQPDSEVLNVLTLGDIARGSTLLRHILRYHRREAE